MGRKNGTVRPVSEYAIFWEKEEQKRQRKRPKKVFPLTYSDKKLPYVFSEFRKAQREIERSRQSLNNGEGPSFRYRNNEPKRSEANQRISNKREAKLRVEVQNFFFF